MQLLLLHLDDALQLQPDFMRSCREAGAQEIRAGDEGAAIRLWGSRQDIDSLAARMSRETRRGRQGPRLCFMGSGDFHHVSSLLLEAALGDDEKLTTVIHFDNHP